MMMTTRSPITIGPDNPRPGKSAVHAIFFSALHDAGGAAPAATPVVSLPRNCSQSAPVSINTAAAAIPRVLNRRIVYLMRVGVVMAGGSVVGVARLVVKLFCERIALPVGSQTRI